MEEFCKICNDGKKFNKLPVHLRTKHGISDRTDYDEFVRQGFKEDALSEKLGLSNEPWKPSVEAEQEAKSVNDEPSLNEIMKQKGLSEEDVINIIQKFESGELKTDSNIVNEAIEKNESIGTDEAARLAHKDKVETDSVYVAESLVENYGFIVEDITTKGGTIPKKWTLIKK